MADFNGMIEVEVGPTLRTALDVLELVGVMLDEMPAHDRKDELQTRTDALVEICERGLHGPVEKK